MDWLRSGNLVMLTFVTLTSAWSSVGSDNANAAYHQQQQQQQRKSEVSPYIDLVLCPIREEPWSCARQQSGRILDKWDNELHSQWQKLKVEADRQLNATMEKRGYSASEVIIKEKPSTILKKIEIGTNYMKKYLAETMDGFLGREYEYLQKSSSNSEPNSATDVDDNNGDENENDDDGDYDNVIENENSDEQTDDADTTEDDNSKNTDKETSQEHENGESAHETDEIANTENTSNDVEFIEIEEANKNEDGQLRKPGNKNKKKKKKGQVGAPPATVLVVQQQPVDHGQHDNFSDGHDGGHGGGDGGGKPLKQKRKKRKKQQHGGGHGDDSVVVVEEESLGDHNFGLGLLEELVDFDDVLDVGGGKRKKKHPSKYGRSNGVTRGKKKKKKKAIMKLVLLGSILKAKIELLLKILGAHLQIKFFAIALIGLLINIARFWIDVKRGGTPQKVVYVEHAHHQHHYEDHGGEEWSEPGGGYWKRSLQTEQSIVEDDTHTDRYQLKPQQYKQPQDAQYMAYQGQWQ